MKPFHLIINGRSVPGALAMDVINPATGDVLTSCPRADAKQLDTAALGKRPRAAFPRGLSRASPPAGRRVMTIADSLEARIDEFARLLTAEQGNPCARPWGRSAAPRPF